MQFRVIFTTASEDYFPLTQEVTFSAEETVKKVTVRIRNDSVLEGAEQFTAILSPIAGPVGVEIRQRNATATIVDDDGESEKYTQNMCREHLHTLQMCKM